MPQEEYEKDFDQASKEEFKQLLSRADSVFIAEAPERLSGDAIQPEPPRGYFYRQVGLYIARHAHVLIALWDGKEILHAEGGGTFETIDFMRRENGIICHIPVSRVSGGFSKELSSNCSTVPKENLPEPDALPPSDKRLAAIDNFNLDVKKQKAKLDRIIAESRPYVIDAETEKTLRAGSGISTLLNVFLLADAMSVRARNHRLLTLRALSLLGLFLVLSFLLYDEIGSDLMLFIYGAIIVSAAAVYLLSKKYGFHNKYITYRALAEALRIQFYWSLCGINENVSDHYAYTQKSEMEFVRFIIKAAGAGFGSLSVKTGSNRDIVYKYWVRGQHIYHTASARKKGKQNQRNNSASKLMFILSIMLFITVVVMELFFKTRAQEALPVSEALRDFLFMHGGQVVLWRSVFKIALGAVAAGTAFLANYYGGLSLPQQIFDNQRMRSLFETAMRKDPPGEAGSQTAMRDGPPNEAGYETVMREGPPDAAGFEETMLLIGRESLNESAGWYVLQRENAQKLFIN